MGFSELIQKWIAINSQGIDQASSQSQNKWWFSNCGTKNEKYFYLNKKSILRYWPKCNPHPNPTPILIYWEIF